ncbi:MAG: hypothetical protein HY657_14690 [Acidobacteria bacterium]|nr:hypothetical protein [Acidobacteriota bacterium]
MGEPPAVRHGTRRRVRLAATLAIGAGWLLLAAVGIYYVSGALIQLWARGLALLPRAVVWMFVAVQEGADLWSLAGRAGAALAGLLAAPQVTMWVVGLELVGAAALYGLQRLLRDEPRDSSPPEVKT